MFINPVQSSSIEGYSKPKLSWKSIPIPDPIASLEPPAEFWAWLWFEGSRNSSCDRENTGGGCLAQPCVEVCRLSKNLPAVMVMVPVYGTTMHAQRLSNISAAGGQSLPLTRFIKVSRPCTACDAVLLLELDAPRRTLKVNCTSSISLFLSLSSPVEQDVP